MKTISHSPLTSVGLVLGSPNDYFGLLLVGTENNYGIQDFDHLSLILPMNPPNKKHIQDIGEMVVSLDTLYDKTGPAGIKC